jgi:hypothetical protein
LKLGEFRAAGGKEEVLALSVLYVIKLMTFFLCIPKTRKFLQHLKVDFPEAQLPISGLECLNVEVSRSHKIRKPHTTGRTPLNE